MAWDKIPSQKEAIKAFLVTTNGKLDLAASVKRYEQVAREHIAKQEADQELIKRCLSVLFDEYKGVSLNSQAIGSMTVQRMIKELPELGHPSLFQSLSKRVSEVLHEDLGDQTSGKTFGMKRGPNGGFFVWADQAPSVSK